MKSSRWAAKPATTPTTAAPDPQPTSTPPSTSTPPPAPKPCNMTQQPAPTSIPRMADPEPPQVETCPSYLDDAPGLGYDDNMDEFAQTRPPDDLFDDDFTPMTEPILEPEPQVPTPVARAVASGPRMGRGARRGGVGNALPSAVRTRTPRTEAQPASNTTTTAAEGSAPAQTDGAQNEQGDKATPVGPARPRTEAVRGDRSGTGGVKKAKLSDAQLTERMQAMALKSELREAAHARAAADLASFEAKEAEATQRRKEERLNRQQMMGEREKNRQRKLNALGGREWDAKKKEEDFAADKSATSRRGAHGGVVGGILSSRYTREGAANGVSGAVKGQRADFVVRGSGIGRGGRGRERADHQAKTRRTQKQDVPTAADFPALPPATPTKLKEGESSKPTTLEFPIKLKDLSSPVGDIRSWADQVEGALSRTA